jgi:hypothetical protein
LSTFVGVEYKSDRIEVACLFFSRMFKETKLFWVIDLNPELAEDIASQGTTIAAGVSYVVAL